MGLFSKKDRGGQRTEAPASLTGQPEGVEATPPSRDPDDAAAPGPGAADRTDLNPGRRHEPDPPEGTAGP